MKSEAYMGKKSPNCSFVQINSNLFGDFKFYVMIAQFSNIFENLQLYSSDDVTFMVA